MGTINKNHLQHLAKYRTNGFSLIEMMIAVVIGLFMLASLVSLFTNFSSMNRAQSGLARIQENGRFIAARMKIDIENVGFQPCATVSMDSPQLINRGFAKRPIINFTNLSNGLPTGVIDPQYFIQGHECNGSGTCSPALGIFPGGDPTEFIPEAGTTVGSRAYKTDVLTVRYLASEPAYVDDSISPSTTSQFTLSQSATTYPLSLESGNKVLVANCHNSIIINAQPGNGSKVVVTSPDASVTWASKPNFTSVYNFTKQFKTVSYYVGFKQSPENQSSIISSLFRIENGNTPQEVVAGVERFDLTYGVQFVDGTMAYLTADQVQNAAISTCTVEPIVPPDFGIPPLANGIGCLWRSVFAVKLNVLLNTVYNSSTSDSEKFVYSSDGPAEQLPNSLPSEIDAGRMYRKEFTKTIALKSNNL